MSGLILGLEVLPTDYLAADGVYFSGNNPARVGPRGLDGLGGLGGLGGRL
jgi:hypothetical protein